MKQFVQEFFRRGMIACGFGPLVLAALYLILHHSGSLESLTVSEVCIGIFSLSALAFLAGGMNTLYQIERLPLMVAIFIHGSVLYGGYLVAYLLNGWLEWSVIPLLVFTGIFIIGYLVIWAVIYSIIRRDAEKINVLLMKKQQQNSNASPS